MIKPTNVKLSNAQMIRALATLGGIRLSRERLRHFRGYTRNDKIVPGILKRGEYWDYQNGQVVWDANALDWLLRRYGQGRARALMLAQLKEYLDELAA